MAQIFVNDISSVMVFTGASSKVNAQALEDRQYGFTDEFLGVLNKTNTNDSAFSYVSKEVFVETTPKYDKFGDLTIKAYSYILNKSSVVPVNEIYVNESDIINFRYNYENNLSSDINNAKTVPAHDVNLFLTSVNNAMYNKQRYYAKNNELDYITYNGIKYYWRKPGTILAETYIGKTHDIGNDYVSYELNSYYVHKHEWDEVNQTYIPLYQDIKNEETGEITREPIMEYQYSVKYLSSIKDIINNKLAENVERYKNDYEKQGFCSYYLYELNNKLSFISNTYSFGKQTFDVYLNYDGEFNNWFNNRISFNLNNLESLENVKLCDIVLGEDYWINATIDENKFICGESKKYNKDTNITLVADKFESNKQDNISLLAPHKIVKLDLSSIAQYLEGDLDLINNYDMKIDYNNTVKTNWNYEKSHMLTELIVGKESVICNINNINGIDELTNLQKIDITGCNNLLNIDLTELTNLNTFIAKDSSLTVFQPAEDTIFDKVVLPATIESLILNKFEVDTFEYEPTDKLTALEFDTVYGIDTYEFVTKWIDILKANDKLSSGIVNFVNLKNIEWQDVSVNRLEELKNLELNEFTGHVSIIGDKSQYISRIDYRSLYNLYGKEVFNVDNDLIFDIKLDENAFMLEFIASRTVTVENEPTEEGGEVTITTIKEQLGSVVANIFDSNSGNSLLNDIQLNPDLYKEVIGNNFINNNRQNIGMYFELAIDLEPNEKSEQLSNIEIGDILLYRNQLVIASKNSKNINTHYIKLGNISSIELLSELFMKLTDFTDVTFEIKTLEIDHNNENKVEDNVENDEQESTEVTE